MSTSESIKQAERRNTARKCDHRTCNRNRHGLSRWCFRHLYRVNMYGHPDGRAVDPKEYAKELEEVSELLDRNHGHPGVQNALKEIEGFISFVCVRPEMPQDIARLKQVKAMDILKEASALTLLHYRTGDWVHNRPFVDEKNFRFVLGYRCLILPGREVVYSQEGTRRTKPSSKRARELLGNTLWQKLSPLLVNITRTILQKEERESQKEEAMRAPLM